MSARLIAAVGGLGLALLAAPASGQEAPRGYGCTFKLGTTLSYAKGAYKAKRARPLSFEVGEIDLEGQRALLVTPAGKGQLRVVRAINANHFLEVVAEGFLNVTTIYDKDARLGVHPAVHSRHFGLFGEPVVAQYHGSCRAK